MWLCGYMALWLGGYAAIIKKLTFMNQIFFSYQVILIQMAVNGVSLPVRSRTSEPPTGSNPPLQHETWTPWILYRILLDTVRISQLLMARAPKGVEPGDVDMQVPETSMCRDQRDGSLWYGNPKVWNPPPHCGSHNVEAQRRNAVDSCIN